MGTTAHAQSPASHAAADPIKHFDVPSGPLATALSQLADQADVLLSVPGSITAGKSSPGVHGDYTVPRAFDSLLSGTGLQALRQDDGSYSLAPMSTDAGSLPTVTVVGRSDGAASQAEMLNPPSTVGSKIPVAQREIPQSVSVITQQQIEQQNASTLADVMRYTPGIEALPVSSVTTSYIARGFPITTFQLDGVPTALTSSSVGAPDEDVSMYDRIEVLRGASGLFNGFGGDGGTINLVRKRAPSTFEASADVGIGNYADHREQLDIGGPLNQSGSLRARVVAMQHDQHLMQDGTWQRDQQVFGTLEADLTSTMTARVGASYTKQFGHEMYGLPVSTDHTPISVPRSLYLGASWNYTQLEKSSEFVKVEQKLADDWKAKVAYNHVQYSSFAAYGIPNSYVDPTTMIGNPYSLSYADKNTQDSLDAFVSGPFELLGRKHQLTLGSSYLHQRDRSYEYLINPDTGLDIFGDYTASILNNSIYSDAFAGGPQSNYTTVSNQYALYANARISILDPLTLVLGAQATWWNSTVTPDSNPYYNAFGTTYSHDSSGPKFTPLVGLVYDINDTYTAYASYTSIYKPQTSYTSFDGGILKPVVGSQFEVGIKGEYFGGRLNTGIALFQIDESNRAFEDPAHPNFYLASGKARSQGFELTASGEVLPGLTVQTGYTYVDARALDDSLTTGGNFSWQPKHQFKAWTNYQLPGPWHKWNIGGGAIVQSGMYSLDSGYHDTAGGYAIFNALVGYEISKNLSVTLSGTNIFNRKYWSAVEIGNGNYYGNPAQVMMTLRARI
ncbi:TonB-dependent siderophore receptor [Pararobbsia silviterrae]|uniref:TonB-dependent siderophore receptor n=1 Tax=Pararobbsia silviterrae TaxID=1792498 RepID=UPI001314C0CF|nr:TonB-dependent receptor [Pararobbsia silviterrae]